MPEISPGRPHPNLPWRRETVGRSPDETGVNAVRVRLAVDDATSLSMAQVGRVARLPHQMASWLRFGNAAQPTMRLRVGTTTGAVHRARCHLMRGNAPRVTSTPGMFAHSPGDREPPPR